MSTVNVTEARSKLYALVKQAAEAHEPVLITGKSGNAVLIGEDDWRAIEETLHLLSVPGMRESIREGLAENVDGCSETAGW